MAARIRPRAGELLVSTPLIGGPEFARTLVLLLNVDDDGALGVIINRRKRRGGGSYGYGYGTEYYAAKPSRNKPAKVKAGSTGRRRA